MALPQRGGRDWRGASNTRQDKACRANISLPARCWGSSGPPWPWRSGGARRALSRVAALSTAAQRVNPGARFPWTGGTAGGTVAKVARAPERLTIQPDRDRCHSVQRPFQRQKARHRRRRVRSVQLCRRLAIWLSDVVNFHGLLHPADASARKARDDGPRRSWYSLGLKA
jgi:hypothetical protein